LSPEDAAFLSYVEHVQAEIELRQIRYFLAVAEERNFTRAAARCHVAQPSLSKQIHEIETTLGAKLFDRLPREAQLTDAGEVFRKEAGKAMEHAQRAISRVRALERKQKRALLMGLSQFCDLPVVQRLAVTAQQSMEECSIESVSGNSLELMLGLLRGKLDLAVVDLPTLERGISFRPLLSEPLAAALPEKHPLATRPIVRLFELKNEQFALLSSKIDVGSVVVKSVLREAGVDQAAIQQVSSLIELLDRVALHRHVGLIRNSASRLRREGVISKPLAGSVRLETAIAWRSDDRNSAMLSFRDALIAFSQRATTAPVA